MKTKKTKDTAPKPALLSSEQLPSLGKYWGLGAGGWCRVQVTTLKGRVGTGGLSFAPLDRRGYPYGKHGALACCEIFWGPVKAWGETAPRVTKKQLAAAGVREYYLRKTKAPSKLKAWPTKIKLCTPRDLVPLAPPSW